MAAFAAVVAACSGGGTEPGSTTKSIDVQPATLALQLGAQSTGQLSATPKNASGTALTGRTVKWKSSDIAVASVSGTGLVSALSAGTTTITATADGIVGSASVQVLPAAVATVNVTVGSATLGVNEMTQAAAVTKDAAGSVLTGRAVQWSSSNTAVATIAPSGLVTAVAVGTANIIATSEGVSGSTGVRVFGTLPNLTLDNVYLTQSVQRFGGGVPLVIGGNPVLVNVFGTLDRPFAAGAPVPRVRISVFNGTTKILDDEHPITGTLGTAVDPATPIHQVVLPVNIVAPGLRVVATIDPDSTLPEATLADNKWPRSGQPQDIPVQTVPVLPIHFVPIYLSSGGSQGTVTQASMSEYLYATHQMHPVSTIDASIGPLFSSDVVFGDGQSSAWLQILQQLDVVRVADGATSHYVGALRPPPGVTFVQYGGFSYIPNNTQSTGPSTRTSVLVSVGWFNRARQTTELVAHELAHTMGRFHAPCGSVANPDPNFPYSGGTIGVYGSDLYGYSLGNGTLPAPWTAGTASDIMSYCTPAWVSDYTYEGLLRARGGAIAAVAAMTASAPGPECDCLIVWGSVTGDSVHLNPSFATRAHVALPERRGAYRLEGLDAAGARLFAYDFEPATIDHAPDVRHFTFAVPLTESARVALARIRVVRGGRAVELAQSGVAPTAARFGADTTSVAATRTATGETELRWNPAEHGAVLVRDAGTGQVIGIGTSGRLRVRTNRNDLDVLLSNGPASTRTRVVIPR
jgi:Big-like domain-containing protein